MEKKETDKNEAVPVKQEQSGNREAVAYGRDLPVSTKHAIAVCNFIRNKHVDKSISLLEDAEKMKIAIPMRGEIPHRRGMMSGRYPVNTIVQFIRLLKSLKSNAIANEIELEKHKIFCKADVASRPYKRFGARRFKRTNVTLKLMPITKTIQKEIKNGR